MNSNDGIYTCAIDVDTPAASVGVEYKILSLTPADISNVSSLSNTFHFIQSVSDSGAIDYVRSSYLAPRLPAGIRRMLNFFLMGHIVRLIEYGWIQDSGFR